MPHDETIHLTSSSDPIVQPVQSPSADLSHRVVQLAYMIDRLPPGNYEISLEKPDLRAQDWNVEIVRAERISNVRLTRYSPE